jgi:hypothetical protein
MNERAEANKFENRKNAIRNFLPATDFFTIFELFHNYVRKHRQRTQTTSHFISKMLVKIFE